MDVENNTNERKILYAITSGEYSDYGICAITSDKERAEKLRLYYTSSYNEAQIEEFVDGDPECGELQNLKPVWDVRAVIWTSNLAWDCWLHHYEQQDFKNTYDLYAPECLSSTVFRALIMARDEEHAIKIAQDQYAKMKAERLGL